MGAQAAQLIHAAGMSSPGYLPEGTYAIALHAHNEAELYKIAESLDKANIPCSRIIEIDAPYTGQLMAIGIAPMDRKRLKKYLSSYALIK